MPTDLDQFERTFADLAFASMKSRAPMLMEHMVGWQLVDVNDDETRAVGIFGFKVGEQWLYAPVFFMNGELKGTELLYLKGQDIFAPLQENWIKYIVNRRPYVLGETEPYTLEQLGYQPPDFTQYSESPETKRAAYEPLLEGIQDDWAKDAVERIFSSNPASDRYEKSASRMDLPTFFQDAGLRAYKAFLKAAGSNENFANAITQFYGKDDFQGLASTDVFSEKKALLIDDHHISGTAPEVVVMLPGNDYADNALKELSDSEKEQLLQGEIVIQDHRQNTSNVFPADLHRRLFSPTESGVYDVLMRNSEFRKLLVIHNPHTINSNSRGNVMIVDPTNKDYMLIHATSIYAKNKYEDDSWREAYESAPELSSIKTKGTYILLGPDGTGSIPFRVRELQKDKKGRTYLRVFERNHAQGGHELIGNHFRNFAQDRYDYRSGPGGWGDDTIVIGDTKSKKLRSAGSTLFVPDSFKAISVSDEYDTHRQIDPGTMADMELEISKMGSMYPIKVYDDGHEVHISSGSAHFPPMSKTAALRSMVLDWNMSEADARGLLKQAKDKNVARAKVNLVKSAQGYGDFSPPNYVTQEARAPYYKGDDKNMSFDSMIGVESQHPYYSNQRVPVPQDPVPLQPYNATADYSNPMQEAADAASSGQKEVFDMSTIGRLSKMVDIGETIDKYQSDLVQGMDRVGRILFIFYWHYDKFADRYGKEDLPELEDSLKNVFKSTGDLILFMKQKSIEPDVNLGMPLAAGQAEVL